MYAVQIEDFQKRKNRLTKEFGQAVRVGGGCSLLAA
jgi:hypothetical protein